MNTRYNESREVATLYMRGATGCPYDPVDPPTNLKIALTTKGQQIRVMVGFKALDKQIEGGFWKFGCYTVVNGMPDEIGDCWIEDGNLTFSFVGALQTIVSSPATPVKTERVPITTPKAVSVDGQLDRLLQSLPSRKAASSDLKRALGVPDAPKTNSSYVFSFVDQDGKTAEITVELDPKIDQIKDHPWIFSCKMKKGWFSSKSGFCYVRDSQVYFRIDGRPQLVKTAAKCKVEGSIYTG